MPSLQNAINNLDRSGGEPLKLEPNDTDLIAAKLAELILADFKALDCSTCGRHFGYQDRQNPKVLVCSSECMAMAQKKLKASKVSGSPSHFLCSTMELHSQSPGSEKGNTYGSLAFNLAKSSKDVEAYEANNYERKMTEARNASTAVDEKDLKDKEVAPVGEGGWPGEPILKGEHVESHSTYKYTMYDIPTSPNLKSGAQIYVNFCWNPRVLAVSAAADVNEMGDLAQAIETHLEIGLVPPLDDTPAVGDIVLCPYAELYYRAVVEEVKDSGHVRVRFVDYGDEVTVDVFELRRIDDVIAGYPIYGMIAIIDEIPEDEVEHLSAITPELQSLIENQAPMKIELMEKVKHGVWNAEVWLPDGKSWSSTVMEALKQTNG